MMRGWGEWTWKHPLYPTHADRMSDCGRIASTCTSNRKHKQTYINGVLRGLAEQGGQHCLKDGVELVVCILTQLGEFLFVIVVLIHFLHEQKTGHENKVTPRVRQD